MRVETKENDRSALQTGQLLWEIKFPYGKELENKSTMQSTKERITERLC